MIDKNKALIILRSARTRKYAIRFAVAFVVVGVLGFLVLPPIVKSVLLKQLAQTLHRPVTVQSISINPYALSVTVDGLTIGERAAPVAAETATVPEPVPEKTAASGQPFFAFDRLYLNLESTSLFRGGVVLGEVQLVNPRLRVVRHEAQRYNFSDLLDAALAGPKSEGPPPRFSVNNIQISGGSIDFDDRPMHEQHEVRDLKLTVPVISNMAYAVESFVEPAFSARVNEAPLGLKGRSKLFAESLESEVALELSRLKLADFVEYSPIKLPIRMRSGALDVQLKLAFSQTKNQPSTLKLSGGVGVHDLNVLDLQERPLLSFKQLDFQLGESDLLGLRFAVERFALEAPEIHARVDREGRVNWLEFFTQALAGESTAASAPAQTSSKPAAKPAAKPKAVARSAPPAEAAKTPPPAEVPPRVPTWSLAAATVSGGAVHWYDESHGAPFNARIDSIDFDARDVSSQAGEKGRFDVAWRIAAGDWLKVERFAVRQGEIDLGGRALTLNDVEVKGAQLLFRRLPDGSIDWIKPPSLRVAEAAQDVPGTPWSVRIAKYSGEGIGLRFEDKSLRTPAVQTIEGLGFTMENLSTAPGEKASLSTQFKLNRKGGVALKGWASIQPLRAEIAVDAKALELLPLQPYFGEHLNVDVTRGLVSVGGKVQVEDLAKVVGKAPELAFGFDGDVTVGDFQAVDKLNSADFLRWKSFHFGKIDVRTAPLAVSVGEIALADFFARVIVSPQGQLNLLQIVRRDEEKPSEVVSPEAPAAAQASVPEGKAVAPLAPEHAPVLPLKIGKITLQGGNVRFTDNFIKPNYSANLRQISGRISGLSSEPGSVANLELRGSYDNVAPLNVVARINPLAAKPYLDLQADVKGIEMTSFTSYSGKYAGYAIDKGKLSLFVNYKIENDLLAAENRLFIDQLTFGDAVESPEATKLPVTLAVSLLKNRNGEIDLNLPISGSLNDPEFSVGGLIVKVVVNLFVKAVASPFSLLGSVFGGGEELSHVGFAAGLARIDADAQKRLEAIAKAMQDRPAIKLEIEGFVDADQDREGLKQARMAQKVRAQKREDLTRKGVETGSIDSIEISDKEYPALLERVYRDEKFPKPRNMIGLVKSLPVEEMEKLILANSVIDDDDLRELGNQRAGAVRDWLAGREIAAERVFVLPARLEAGAKDGEGKDAAKGSGPRVVFGLK